LDFWFYGGNFLGMKKALPNPTLALSLAFCLIFLFFAFAFPTGLAAWLSQASSLTLRWFGGYYLWLGVGVVAVLVVVAASPLGRVRLGRPGERPEYSTWAWVAMLYSTGMGAGLLLRAVQEPLYYYTHPPVQVATAPDILALEYTFFHWGFTPWGFYGLFGLIIAYFLYVRGRGILPSAAVGPASPALVAVIDAISLISTILGVVAAVGLGSSQLLGGLNHLGQWTLGLPFVLLVIGVVTAVATLSARSGLGRSIKWVSQLNLAGALFLLAFVWFQTGPAAAKQLALALGHYLRDFLALSLNLGAYHAPDQFLADWTYFYWAFWLAWTPFTGVFIARISRGRTLRAYVAGTLLVPALGTFVWFAGFGTSAFRLVGSPAQYQGQYDSIYSAIFVFFQQLPWPWLTNPVAVAIVFTFLLTSVDSAIFVLSIFSDGGRPEPSARHRLLWGVMLGLFTIAVVLVGREGLLRSVSQLLVLFALPFALVFGGMVVAWGWAVWRR
jgi:glycine betaine transporter